MTVRVPFSAFCDILAEVRFFDSGVRSDLVVVGFLFLGERPGVADRSKSMGVRPPRERGSKSALLRFGALRHSAACRQAGTSDQGVVEPQTGLPTSSVQSKSSRVSRTDTEGLQL